MYKHRNVVLTVALLLCAICSHAQSNSEVLKRMLNFGETHREMFSDTMSTNVYTKYTINVVKRNAMLAAVPTMFYILRDGRRHYFSEAYSRVKFDRGSEPGTHRYIHLSTVYHRHNTLPPMTKYLTPSIYSEKLFQDGILSPINYHNRKFYRYGMKRNGDGTSLVTIRSRYRNTQLIRKGFVFIVDSTGQVLQFNFEGEYDMIRSCLNGTMHRDSGNVMFPDKCDVQAKLSFMGNKILCHYVCLYDQPFNFPDSIIESHDRNLMARVRPIPLAEEEKRILDEYDSTHKPNRTATTHPNPSRAGGAETPLLTTGVDSVGLYDDSTIVNTSTIANNDTTININSDINSTIDSTQSDSAYQSNQSLPRTEESKGGSQESNEVSHKNWAKYVFWDIIGDNMLNKIKANIGAEEQGQIRIGPIFNPFYFGYTRHKGLIYRFDIRGYYNFSNNHNITGRVKLGYSFKQKQWFYKIPVQWNFNKRRNGYVMMEFNNGNRITNSRVLDNVKQYRTNDSIDWDAMHLDYFRDTRFHMELNYDVVKNHLGVAVGFTKHRRAAIDASGFRAAGRPTVYKTFAPFLQLQYRPLSDKVPLVLTGQWQHGLNHFGGKVAYDRFEFDGQYIQPLTRMRSWQLRSGFGFYTHKGHDDYFLDYHNFHEEYISLGWEDKWSGEFEMLNSNWYNASNYYVRANATYESPMMLLAYCPLIGQIVEKERVYISTLAVTRMFPYVELGYGFTNRIFSMGVFMGFSPHNFEGFGMKFGFELFNNY